MQNPENLKRMGIVREELYKGDFFNGKDRSCSMYGKAASPVVGKKVVVCRDLE